MKRRNIAVLQWSISSVLMLCSMVILLLVVYSPVSSADEKIEIEQLIQQMVTQHNEVPSFVIYGVQVQNIRFSDDKKWAIADLVFLDMQTKEIIPTEPGMALARQSELGWKIVLQADAEWNSWLDAVPESLMLPEEKDSWKVHIEGLTGDRFPLSALGGYKLPWACGQTKRLTRSISHGNGKDHFAFDFADGTMFEIRAAKSGIVEKAVWSYPNNTHTDSAGRTVSGNYLLVKDSSTSPTTYILYAHLAYNTIPEEKRKVGATVLQGDVIGNADNTGHSSGTHLHFQVHTTPTWFAQSVDITFDDVPINGGRPRTPKEALSGEQNQTYYTSGNCGGASACNCDGTNDPVLNCTIASGQTLNCTGKNSIRLVPNFHAGQGSTVTLKP